MGTSCEKLGNILEDNWEWFGSRFGDDLYKLKTQGKESTWLHRAQSIRSKVAQGVLLLFCSKYVYSMYKAFLLCYRIFLQLEGKVVILTTRLKA